MTVMGDALMDGLSDAGSTPARSSIPRSDEHLCVVFRSDTLKILPCSKVKKMKKGKKNNNRKVLLPFFLT